MKRVHGVLYYCRVLEICFSKVMEPKQLKNWGEEWDYDLESE